MTSATIDSRRKKDLYERLRSLGVNVSAVEKCDLSYDELSDLTDRLEKLVNSRKQPRWER
ncbi:hypothetical protein NTE_02498 [Candidatus Nitrososphaera evergladensis SR1]|jgi:post-segregation antitoxin (ccd killing protein)|uniref:Uncharacterized protein n=1 Tax=Candidatus Nitrososphaera evergladensis SR1 TaxID=1459636 RepID=A0A075MV65_9ARCH|nr:hypothetical protein [Candidatus Nitrososphaera evergladensis]AIF84547.1 hypothetical protein NTE_02498 [Candidatus Nitrososphaera evergladensis SR1]